jgi:hypothetical protein
VSTNPHPEPARIPPLHGERLPAGWVRVIEPEHCQRCNNCSQLVCPLCGGHYANCRHPSSSQHEEHVYATLGPRRVLIARPRTDADTWPPGEPQPYSGGSEPT